MSEQSVAPDDRQVTCDDFDASVAELALEILDARERDVLMAHAATCERCTTELEQMSAAADRLTLLAPEGEPPVGFEQRVMESLAVRQLVRRRAMIRPGRVPKASRFWTTVPVASPRSRASRSCALRTESTLRWSRSSRSRG